jgi:hypothetical protein
MQGFAAIASVAVIAASAFGCSSGLSKSDADIRCTEEQQSKSSCFDPGGKVYGLCESCYERCGNDCTPQSTCPATYLCPGDAPIDAGSL